MHSPGPIVFNAEQAEDWMRQAIAEARHSAQADEVPVGCLVLDAEGRVTGTGGDGRQAAADPWAHAEVNAIRKAAREQGDWRLDGYTLVVTLEPCPMCAGLILMSRVGRVIYGAANDKWGAAGTRNDLLTASSFPHRPEIIGGVMADECGALLSEYFARRRKPKST